jgi:flagellar export protein FliJ
MKKFSFSLQSVQDHRAVRRETAERDFAAAAHAVTEAHALLDKTTRERNLAVEAYVKLIESGKVEPHDLTLRVSHIAFLVQRENERRAHIQLLERARDAKRLAVIDSTRDEKAISNLHERHRARYDTEAARTEQIGLDEMATMAFLRRTG